VTNFRLTVGIDRLIKLFYPLSMNDYDHGERRRVIHYIEFN